MDSSQSCVLMPRCCGIDIEDCSILQLQDYFGKDVFSSRDLVQCYLERIELINPRLKAIIETNPDALLIADRLDDERQNGHIRTQLHGIPFLLKDNIATKDKMQTTAGSAALVGTSVAHDAHVVTLLREAGAILLGKANLSEFASMRASYYAEGYSSRGGQNRNPYNLAHHPGGSSSGSASALASNMCAFSIGTETDGSIMFPADRNSVVGIKPTVGLTSTEGLIPESPSMDTVGPLARSVEDATLVLDVITGRGRGSLCDPRECCSAPYMWWLSKRDALKGAKFGLPQKRVWKLASQNKSSDIEYKALNNVIRQMEKAGAQVMSVEIPSAEEIISPAGWDWNFGEGETNSRLSEFQVVRTEFYHSIGKHLSSLSSNWRNILSLEDIIAYNIRHTQQEGGVPGTHPAWPTGQDNFNKCVESKDWPNDRYLEALSYMRLKSQEQGIDAALKFDGVDLDGLLVPLQADSGAACSVAAKAGYPMITIPVGFNSNGLPFGIGIIQTAWKEELLVKYGSAIEDLIRGRRLPKFLNLEAENYPYVGTPPRLQ
ncbi:amidase signature domain-containing protein [Bisporella sp. PMI_857]|nr:amidase signature domain-containing protein [Bisporella sp. PMI_857]